MDDSTSVTEATTGWARLYAVARPFARPMPRSGAWYPVVGDASGERAVLQVRGKRVAVQKKFLEIRSDRPKVFTVVVRSRDAAEGELQGGGASLGRVYAVCPACTERMRIVQRQESAQCPRCHHRGEVAWWETG